MSMFSALRHLKQMAIRHKFKRLFQDAYDERVVQAQKKHLPSKPIRKEQTEALHEALRGRS